MIDAPRSRPGTLPGCWMELHCLWIPSSGTSRRGRQATCTMPWNSPLLPQDMADLRSLKKHEVFLTLKRDLAMVSSFPPFYLLFIFY